MSKVMLSIEEPNSCDECPFSEIGKTGKDVIDYITDQIDKVVNDKEEDKK